MNTPANDDINHPVPGKFKVLSLYIGFLLVVLMQFPMDMLIGLLSVILLAVLGMVIAFCRRESEPGSLVQNHATYISRTLWMWSFLLFLGVAAAGIYVYQVRLVSMDALMQMSQDVLQHNMNTPTIRALVKPSLFAMVPSTAYIAVRYATGFARALRGYRMAKPKSFF